MYIILGHYSGGGTPVLIRIQKLSPLAPMVLPGYPGGRVGRGQELYIFSILVILFIFTYLRSIS